MLAALRSRRKGRINAAAPKSSSRRPASYSSPSQLPAVAMTTKGFSDSGRAYGECDAVARRGAAVHGAAGLKSAAAQARMLTSTSTVEDTRMLRPTSETAQEKVCIAAKPA